MSEPADLYKITDPIRAVIATRNLLDGIRLELAALDDAGGWVALLRREPERRAALLGHVHAAALVLARLSTLIDRASDDPELDRRLAEDRRAARNLLTEIRARKLRAELAQVAVAR